MRVTCVLVLALVAAAALAPVNLAGPQDRTRYELTRHLALAKSIELEPTLTDRATYNGRTYSDKAPGMSFLGIAAFEFERAVGVARSPAQFVSEGDASLWGIRVLTSGILFLVAVIVVGMISERIAMRTGLVVAALFGTATLAAPLAPSLFEHDAAGALGIAAFALLWFRHDRPGLVAAGLLAGFGVFFDYEAGVIALGLLAYAAWRHRAAVAWFVLGAVPPALMLGAYDWAAFDSPFHLSYRYVSNDYSEQQRQGFFGIGMPSAHGLEQVLVGPRGLLTWSPLCLLAAVGLWLLWRRGLRAEALLAAALTLAFVLLDAGYFLPYGGGSPGPRFAAECLPFLALGLAPMLERQRVLVLIVGVVSVCTTTVQAVSWGVRSIFDTAYVPAKTDVSATIWSLAGLNRNLGAAFVLVAALLALGVAVTQLLVRPFR
jgi:hypothetical protein